MVQGRQALERLVGVFLTSKVNNQVCQPIFFNSVSFLECIVQL
jgi:hypothetical protein